MKCSSFINLIISSNKISNDIEFNLKYVLITINELSNNPESFKEGESENLINLIICLEENFEKYWPNVENYLKNQKQYLKETIQAVKKDTIKIILQTLSNLADIIHYDELDGYISDKKANKTLSGLIIFNKSEEIQKKILDFSKKLNEFGEGNYNLGGIFASIRIYDELDMNSDNEVKANYIKDKDIVILTNPNFLIRNYNGYILKILVFESPLVSIKSNDGIEGSLDALNTLVSISLYDKNEKEIPVTNITENFRPNILYLKSKYNNINLCLYYNEEKKELDNEDILFFNESYLFNGKEYFKCTSKNLASFVAGSNNFLENNNNKFQILFLILIFIIIKKRCINNSFESDSSLIEKINEGEELFSRKSSKSKD